MGSFYVVELTSDIHMACMLSAYCSLFFFYSGLEPKEILVCFLAKDYVQHLVSCKIDMEVDELFISHAKLHFFIQQIYI